MGLLPSKRLMPLTNPTRVAWGVDGCKDGWFYFRLPVPSGDITFGVITELRALFDRESRTASDRVADTDIVAQCDLMLVDIPIGLPDEHARQSVFRKCDREARKKLGSRQQSVFPVPVRSVLENRQVVGAKSWKEARAHLAEQHPVPDDEKGRLTAQSFAILRKIREADDLLSTSDRAANTVRETHPEVCFWAFGRKKPEPMEFSKAHGVGFLERVHLLEQCRSGAKDAILAACRTHRTVGSDDIVDAMVCALTATAHELETLPSEPQKDSRGLTMEIVYASRDAVRKAYEGVPAHRLVGKR